MIETTNLIIKQFTADDTPFVFELLNTETWKQFIGDRNIQILDDALGYIEKVLAPYYDKYGYGPWLVSLKEKGEPIGLCGLFKRDYLDQPDLGFAFMPQYAGKGLAYESCLAILEYVTKAYNIKKLYATTTAANIRSQGLLERCGFVRNGEITPPEGEPLLLYHLSLQ
ncbi:GNAT family N-acetyltransferase [Mucilaginibacter litoreus]|uniref:GNAT family N-acetyltransferase n=1 Tax=Mucilaginibacter litoreus TaxID=1048221 RepID=A0ABW3AS46_9SPHI